MTLSFENFLGLILSFITEVFSIPVIEWGENADPVTVGHIILASILIPVMYTLLFPSFSR